MVLLEAILYSVQLHQQAVVLALALLVETVVLEVAVDRLAVLPPEGRAILLPYHHLKEITAVIQPATVLTLGAVPVAVHLP
jgi:ABC-type uncharacterized transport system ATPase subunit